MKCKFRNIKYTKQSVSIFFIYFRDPQASLEYLAALDDLVKRYVNNAYDAHLGAAANIRH